MKKSIKLTTTVVAAAALFMSLNTFADSSCPSGFFKYLQGQINLETVTKVGSTTTTVDSTESMNIINSKAFAIYRSGKSPLFTKISSITCKQTSGNGKPNISGVATIYTAASSKPFTATYSLENGFKPKLTITKTSSWVFNPSKTWWDNGSSSMSILSGRFYSIGGISNYIVSNMAILCKIQIKFNEAVFAISPC